MTTVPLLEAERLTVRRAGRAALDDVSMAVAGGDMVALYGPSGSGKSTLLAVLAGLEPPDEGEVRSEGRDLHGLPAEQRRALRRGRIALVLQAYGLLALLTARENVELAQRRSGRDPAQARAAATGWLEELGLAGRAELRPHAAADRRPCAGACRSAPRGALRADWRKWSPRSDSNRRPSDYESRRLGPAGTSQALHAARVGRLVHAVRS
jgi:ABC-type sulfate/molybdate transport systems ATPase subunit